MTAAELEKLTDGLTTESAADRSVPVLVVDDNPGKRLALKSVLLPLGYSIVEAGSGEEALRRVMDQDFAVILLDVCMPLMDGFETAALIRQRHQSEMTPIIFVTAYGSDEIGSADHYAEGAVDFMFAPVPPEEIRAKVSVFANLFLKAEALAIRAREVQTTADQLKFLTDATPIGIFQVDAARRYVYTNPRWTEIMGVPSEVAAGKTWDCGLDLQRVTGSASEPSAEGATPADLGGRFELRTPDEESRILLVRSRPIPDCAGNIAGWVGTVEDVSTDALAERALSDARDAADEASRLKSDFLANMSHEIRTPMNGVIGMTDLLLETELDDRQRDYAQTVRDSGEALLIIINDILDFSKIEAGKVEIENIEFNLRDVVRDVVDLLARSAQAKGLELAAVVHEALPSAVNGDPGRIRQVLTNLIGNAIKFTQTGEISVKIAAIDITGTDTVVRFEVSDTGDGVEPDKLQTIFQPFVQADTSTSRKYGGTGLGLAISGQLVALMGGDHGASSTVGTGSTFWFTIRVQHTAKQLEAPNAGRLLLAEDNSINQKVAVAMLSGAGYVVDTVSDGAAAVAAAVTQHYDAVLMDCQMPQLSGYEATAAIRAHEGADRHTPIIALTAGARREDRERCLAEGMDGYLAKPLIKGVLLALVAKTVTSGHGTTDAAPLVAHPATAEVMIDPAVLDELLALAESSGHDFLPNLVEQFVRETEPRLVELRTAVETGAADSVGGIAHLIQGSALQLGGRRLALSCSRLENKATAGFVADARPDMQGVDMDYQDLRRTLTELMAPADDQHFPCLHA